MNASSIIKTDRRRLAGQQRADIDNKCEREGKRKEGRSAVSECNDTPFPVGPYHRWCRSSQLTGQINESQRYGEIHVEHIKHSSVI